MVKMRKNSLLFIFHLIGSFYLIQTSQIEKFILILLLQGIFIFFEYKNSKGDVYIQEKYFLFYILLFTLLTQKIIFNSFLLTFCMMLGIYFTLSSIISFFYLILEEKKFEIFYLAATFVYLILFCLIIFIEYLKTYMNSDEFYYFIYYIYSFLLCFLLKKDIEQRNPYIDIIKTHKFDIYSLSFISFNIFFIWFLLYIGNIYRNYYLLYVYVLVILSIVICQNFISFKINKFFKFILTILIFLIIIFFINKKIYYVLIDQNIIKNIKTFLILYIIVLPLIIPLNIYSSSGDKVYTAFGVKLKDKGKGSWTSAQTSVIAKNGGEITTDNFKDIGAIVGSENEKEKLKISAKTIEVKDLEDSNKYENVGGGISLGFEENKPQVPNISVVHDKIDKKQITRATAINTEIKVNNEIVKAEDLGFNTDISNSQETTKDKEKHLNAELHTDLFNKSERNKLIEAKKKIETVVENLGNSNRFKEGIAGVELDKFKNERQKEFNLINDTNISLEDKRRIVQDLYRDFLRSKGYKGDIPEVILTDEENSFSVDSKDKETGEKRKERIFISINNLNNKDFSKVFVHELAHMNTYDEGYLGEETSLYTRSKLEPDDKTKVFSEADKEKYLESLRAKYPKQKSLEEQYAEAKLVPDKDRKHWAVGKSINGSGAFLGRVNGGRSKYFIYNENTGKLTYVKSTDIGVGFGTIGVGASGSVVFLKNVNTVKDLEGHSFVFGGSYTVTSPWSIGLEIIYDSNREFSGIRISGGVGKGLKEAPPIDGYFSIDSTIITHNEDITKFKEKIEKNIEYNLDEISKLAKDPETAIKNSYKLNKISKKLIDDVNRLRK